MKAGENVEIGVRQKCCRQILAASPAVLNVLACLLLGALSPAAAQPAFGQRADGPNYADGPELLFTRDRQFRIPFRVDPQELGTTREVQLWVSNDQGQRWEFYASALPTANSFTFTARGDGRYWFAVRTGKTDGTFQPPSVTGSTPGLRVYVDTTAPQILMEGRPTQGDRIGFAWSILEEHLNLNTLRAEFRQQGSADWLPLPIPAQSRGEFYRRPGINGPLEIRLRVTDRAGNENYRIVAVDGVDGSRAQPVSDAGDGPPPVDLLLPGAAADGPPRDYAPPPPPNRNPGQPPPPPNYGSAPSNPNAGTGFLPPDPPLYNGPAVVPPRPAFSQPPAPPANGPGDTGFGFPPADSANPNQPPPREPLRPAAPPAMPDRRLVNATEFGLNYEVEDLGRSGLGKVALYYTYDGRKWNFYGEDEDRVAPFRVRVNGEGLYGFSLIAQSGAGIGEEPPQPGDPPQMWVEVDLTPPDVTLYPPQPGEGGNAGQVFFSWTARDKNLVEDSFRLFYGESASGPWHPIADRLTNAGKFQWLVPTEVPYKFYVRLEAEDRAGNTGHTVSDRPVIIDLVRPKLRLTNVQPSKS